ncbi:metallothiol transferase FosB [Paenibacillus sp. tmac-D7]|uniref:metallothiol transferase FosB n=1 Tax=Paenibacillus sp. tmac-D7 TaxID=2591462 RepID=UPI0011411D89|nr:metallothiol transferase FosB [Paenibacillus sp. tmac-D7]
MEIKGLNHITFSVSNLEKSILFYEQALKAKLMVKAEKMAYFDLHGIWLALNVQMDIPRNDIHSSYTHMAFTVDEHDFEHIEQQLKNQGVSILDGRNRDEAREGKSIYFTDPDGHKFEFHTGNLQKRIQYYKDEKKNMTFYI